MLYVPPASTISHLELNLCAHNLHTQSSAVSAPWYAVYYLHHDCSPLFWQHGVCRCWYTNNTETAEGCDDFWTNAEAIQLYKDSVKAILTRTNTLNGLQYGQDPTIFAWNLINEGRCETDNCTAADIQVCSVWAMRYQSSEIEPNGGCLICVVIDNRLVRVRVCSWTAVLSFYHKLQASVASFYRGMFGYDNNHNQPQCIHWLHFTVACLVMII